MTDDQKSNDCTGWVAWHPERGLYYLSFGVSRCACESNLAYWKNSELEFEEERLKEYEAQGWRIRPVRLQFLDEKEKNPWVRVEDHLPPHSAQNSPELHLVLVRIVTHNELGKFVRHETAMLYPNGKWSHLKEYDRVTHWMPIPTIEEVEPYKGEV